MGARLPPDWREFFVELTAHEVRFVVIGALAVAAHAEPRFSEDLDVFAQPSLANAKRLRAALIAFGFGDAVASASELAKAGPVWMLGRKPLRIDILTEISGVSWAQAWSGRLFVDLDGLSRRKRCGFSLGLGPSLALSIAPHATGIARLFGRYRLDWFSLELAVDAALPASRTEAAAAAFRCVASRRAAQRAATSNRSQHV